MTTYPYLVPTTPETPEPAPSAATEPRRLTLLARSGAATNVPHGDSTRVVAVDALAILLRASIDGIVHLDVERVILDRSTDPAEFLKFLAALPTEFGGDVLLITDDRGAYLSTSGRGGGRMLYSLTADDVVFYLSAHDLAQESRLLDCGNSVNHCQ